MILSLRGLPPICLYIPRGIILFFFVFQPLTYWGAFFASRARAI